MSDRFDEMAKELIGESNGLQDLRYTIAKKLREVAGAAPTSTERHVSNRKLEQALAESLQREMELNKEILRLGTAPEQVNSLSFQRRKALMQKGEATPAGMGADDLQINSNESISIPFPNPTPEMLDKDPLFEAIWAVIKKWDINVPDVYGGYCGATGNHVRAIYDAVRGHAQAAAETSRKEFSAECKRFHEEGKGCCTCGREDLEAIEARITAAATDARAEIVELLIRHRFEERSDSCICGWQWDYSDHPRGEDDDSVVQWREHIRALSPDPRWRENLIAEATKELREEVGELKVGVFKLSELLSKSDAREQAAAKEMRESDCKAIMDGSFLSNESPVYKWAVAVVAMLKRIPLPTHALEVAVLRARGNEHVINCAVCCLHPSTIICQRLTDIRAQLDKLKEEHAKG